MGFWLFMLCMVLLVPLSMLGFGRLFIKKAPHDINYVFGYRTRRSMRNKETWAFAHEYIGKLWSKCGIILLPLSIIPMLIVLRRDANTIGTVGGILTMLQLIALVGSIVPTERALKKKFGV